MRQDWKQAPPQIRAEILGKLRDFGAYNAALHAMSSGYAVGDTDAWCPLHVEHRSFMAAGDPASANAVKNSDIARWNDEENCIAVVLARESWRQTTSIEGDRTLAKVDVEKRRAEERERYAVARANEMRAAEEAKAHSLRLDFARAEFDRQHPPTNGVTAKQKEPRA